jgi:hypothetical protein
MLTDLGCRRAREFMTNEARALWMCGSRGTLTLHILWPTVQPGHGGLAPPRKTYITPRLRDVNRQRSEHCLYAV